MNSHWKILKKSKCDKLISTNEKIAIDVVLLLTEDIKNICKKINSKLNWKIDFNNSNKIPHISIIMWVIEKKNIEKIKEIIEEINKNLWEIEIKWKIENYIISETKENILSIKIEKNDKIIKYFLTLKEILWKYFSYDVKLNMFYNHKEVEIISTSWVKWYWKKTENNFDPHITLWIWNLKNEINKIFSFETNGLWLYQLWNYCTCSNKL